LLRPSRMLIEQGCLHRADSLVVTLAEAVDAFPPGFRDEVRVPAGVLHLGDASGAVLEDTVTKKETAVRILAVPELSCLMAVRGWEPAGQPKKDEKRSSRTMISGVVRAASTKLYLRICEDGSKM